ncbi:MAG: heme-binding protein [Pseudomonadota bacterium]
MNIFKNLQRPMSRLLPAVFALAGAAHAADAERLTHDQSQSVAAGVVACAAGKDLRIAVAIVDDRLSMFAYRRMDDVREGAAQFAIDKAHSAAAWHWPTENNQKAVERGETAFVMSAPHMANLGGGLPIFTKAGALIGGVGVSGSPSKQDIACAEAGIKSAGLLHAAPEE